MASRIKTASNRLLAHQAAALEAFDRTMRLLARRWQRAVVENLPDALIERGQRAVKVKDLVTLQKEVQRQLNRLDYEGKIKDFIRRYDEAEDHALAALDALDVPPARLSALNEAALATVRKMDYEFLIELGPATVREVARGVILDALAAEPRSTMIERIADTLESKFAARAVTYADTALVSYDRRVTMETWKAAGIEQFLYRGPKDIKNRPFCESRVGKVFKLEEIEAMDNGDSQPKPVLAFGGGWNCRHVWSPVV